MLLYRVFSWLEDAPEGELGPLYVPEPTGAGRGDNPGHYRALYLSSAVAGAVAEAFGTLKHWTPRVFRRPGLPGGVRALATYAARDDLPVFDMDDADALKVLGLRPSDVVTRDRAITQRWALTIFQRGTWSGVRWWSYYDPRWYSYTIWDVPALTVVPGTLHALSIDDPALIEASEALRRSRRSH